MMRGEQEPVRGDSDDGGLSQVIFICSLPRSGSTLLQRMLACQPGVETAPEPWLLLPVFYCLRRSGIYAEYQHDLLQAAVEDFVTGLPNGKEDFWAAVRRYARELYSRRGGEKCRYFVDKTPRYHLIVRELIDAFPGARFVFLWRHPLAVLASMMETWAKGRWNLYKYRIDIYEGLASLIGTYEANMSSQRVTSIRYEDLVDSPTAEHRRLCEEMGIPVGREETAPDFSQVEMDGRMGDPYTKKGRRDGTVNARSVHKWKTTLTNPLRKRFAQRYLDWIGEHRLGVMGYQMSELKDELSGIPTDGQYLASDVALRLLGVTYSILEPRITLHKWRNLLEPGKPRIHR